MASFKQVLTRDQKSKASYIILEIACCSWCVSGAYLYCEAQSGDSSAIIWDGLGTNALLEAASSRECFLRICLWEFFVPLGTTCLPGPPLSPIVASSYLYSPLPFDSQVEACMLSSCSHEYPPHEYACVGSAWVHPCCQLPCWCICMSSFALYGEMVWGFSRVAIFGLNEGDSVVFSLLTSYLTSGSATQG